MESLVTDAGARSMDRGAARGTVRKMRRWSFVVWALAIPLVGGGCEGLIALDTADAGGGDGVEAGVTSGDGSGESAIGPVDGGLDAAVRDAATASTDGGDAAPDAGTSDARDAADGGREPSDASDVDAAAACDEACRALRDCGATTPANCSSVCQTLGAPDYPACLARAGEDCNAIALCFFAQVCGGGDPSGDASCQSTQKCEGSCAITDPTMACGCGCIGAMSPATAFDLFVNNQCVTNCAPCQGSDPNTAACDQCVQACVMATKCAGE